MNPQTKERNELFENIFDGKKPSRVPIFTNVDNAFCLEYAGKDLRTQQFSVEENLEAIDATTRDFHSDDAIGVMFRFPSMYKMLGAKNFVMGSDGFLQHPNVVGLQVEEYDELIADPMKAIWDRVITRHYSEFGKGGVNATKAMAKAFHYFNIKMGFLGQGVAEIANKYGRSTIGFAGKSAASTVPFDTLADQLRSFTGIMADIRRVPEKVVDACEALLPLAIKAGVLPHSDKYVRTFIPLHMGPYLRNKDFDKFYWPTFKKMVEGLVDAGTATNIFVEQDYTRFLDHLNDLPEGQVLLFEYGDPKEIKQKLGDKHIISGLYPVTLLRNGSKQECVDKAKELVDILAPGGNYIFSFDKSIIRLNDVNPDNMKAVLDFVQEYATY
ncbi:MAG TPA: uroporphyrinogen decarboxylase [Eubacteriaceae bacterium]|nr:uroporphyrinogen decarboxylase [Eubacteriaceae bacterium]